MPRTSRRPFGVDATATITATETMRPFWRTLRRVDPEVGPVSFERTIEECRHPLVDLGAEPATWLFVTPGVWFEERFRRHGGNAGVVRQELVAEKGVGKPAHGGTGGGASAPGAARRGPRDGPIRDAS